MFCVCIQIETQENAISGVFPLHWSNRFIVGFSSHISCVHFAVTWHSFCKLYIHIIGKNSEKSSTKIDHLKQNTGGKKKNKQIIFQICILITSYSFSWIPSSLVYLSSLFMSNYPVNLPLWVTLFIMPQSSVMNPVVFILFRSKKDCDTKKGQINWKSTWWEPEPAYLQVNWSKGSIMHKGCYQNKEWTQFNKPFMCETKAEACRHCLL